MITLHPGWALDVPDKQPSRAYSNHGEETVVQPAPELINTNNSHGQDVSGDVLVRFNSLAMREGGLTDDEIDIGFEYGLRIKPIGIGNL